MLGAFPFLSFQQLLIPNTMEKSQPSQCRDRLSLNFSADPNPLVCWLMFADTLTARITKDLKLEGKTLEDDNNVPHQERKSLMDLQIAALEVLSYAPYNALLWHKPFPSKLEQEEPEEIKKRPSFLAPQFGKGRGRVTTTLSQGQGVN